MLIQFCSKVFIFNFFEFFHVCLGLRNGGLVLESQAITSFSQSLVTSIGQLFCMPCRWPVTHSFCVYLLILEFIHVFCLTSCPAVCAMYDFNDILFCDVCPMDRAQAILSGDF
jgi:hypothetical protein